MRKFLTAVALAAGLSLLVTAAAAIADSARAAAPPPPADPAQALLARVNIPYETFTLDNGLRVVVHEDRKAPVVAVSIWYNVGSKDEPAGRTGFAHLFEHLMFNGSENAPGDYFEDARARSAPPISTAPPGSTAPIISRPCRARRSSARLFLESDRMGHLLGAVTQEKLDNQIGVVQNEKRQGDNEPFGLVEYAQLEGLFPEGHPYRHSTIGSMADLDGRDAGNRARAGSARITAPTMPCWCSPATSTPPRRGRWSSAISATFRAGRSTSRPQADVPTLAGPRRPTMHDRVANTRLYRNWVVPGLTHADQVPLQVAAAVLGGLASSRLDNQLVRGEQTAVSVTAFVLPFQRVSLFEVQVDVKPGQDAEAVSRRLDAIIADYHRQRPDRGRGAPHRDAHPLRPHPGPRAGRRLRRQGGRPGRRRALRQQSRFLPHPPRAAGARDAGAGARGDAALADPSGLRASRRSGRARGL